MKLLSWIRATKQNGLYPSKEFKGDFCCPRAQVSSEVQDIRTNSFSFYVPSHEPKPPKIEEEPLLDEDGFCGFLAIEMLGTDPETPKFAEESVTGEKKELAKLITEKLDKFLEAKGDRRSNACPLQGFDLLRPSMKLMKRRNGGGKKKKFLLTSLFKKRQAVQGESNYMEKHGTRDLIKRLFDKLHGSSSKNIIDYNDDDYDDDYSMPKKKDHRKNVQILSKVHPVLSTPAADDNKRENWIKTDAEYLVLEL